jgi:uncharacterized protein involved in response to NO
VSATSGTRVLPYRALFPIGAAFALIGVAPWILYGLGLAPWPGALHRTLMIQGFEQAFVLGFLLTAMPGLTHSEPCRPAELAVAVLAVAASGAAALLGATVVAAAAFLAGLLLVVAALGRRLPRARVQPPRELMFVGFGLVLGMLGGALQLAAALGAPLDPAPRFGERLVSLGFVLSLVLGVGSLLVPVITGARDPLRIPGIAGAHEGRRRAWFYGALIALLALAFAAEAAGRPGIGAILRASAATVMLLWVWKLVRRPQRREPPALGVWASGWLVLAGLWSAALLPAAALAGLHLVFIGGFGLLTMGVGTRVVVMHGGHGAGDERVVFGAGVAVALAGALAARIAAELVPAGAPLLLAASAVLWSIAWTAWAWRALPRIRRIRRPTPAA